MYPTSSNSATAKDDPAFAVRQSADGKRVVVLVECELPLERPHDSHDAITPNGVELRRAFVGFAVVGLGVETRR